MLPFQFDPKSWEEHFINKASTFVVKEGHSKRGIRAVLPLNCSIQKEKIYRISIRFKIKITSPEINFHIYNSTDKDFR